MYLKSIIFNSILNIFHSYLKYKIILYHVWIVFDVIFLLWFNVIGWDGWVAIDDSKFAFHYEYCVENVAAFGLLDWILGMQFE